MKICILILGLFISFVTTSNAQMTFAGSLPYFTNYDLKVVNLSLSGKKYAVVKDSLNIGVDTIYYYNLDFSLWKIIPCPSVPGYYGIYTLGISDVPGITYSSETLFNNDTLLEVAVLYAQTGSGLNHTKLMIINENGVIIDSIINCYSTAENYFSVHSINASTFVATMPTYSGFQIYNLPGTLPCDVCGGGLGLAKTEEKPVNLLSSPIPNPSKDQVKITFTLPEGATRGELTIYNTQGQKMKSYTVDNRFGFVMVDNTTLAPGMYYYNLVVNGAVSSTQKMLVIK